MKSETKYVPMLRDYMCYSFEKIGKPFEDGREAVIGSRGFYALYVLGVYDIKSMTEIGNACGIQKQQTTKVVEKLISLGFAERVYCQNDRRVIRIAITQSGRDYLSEQIDSGVRTLLQKLERLPERDRKSFLTAVGMLNPVLQKLD